MTCYGLGTANRDGVAFEIEVKSVNHRFLDTQLRLPREYLPLEPKILTLLRKRFNRGRVEVFVRIERSDSEGRLHFDTALAQIYLKGLLELKGALNLGGSVDIGYISSQPGVIRVTEPKGDADADWPLFQDALSMAIENALKMRTIEGENLRLDLQNRLLNITKLRGEIGDLVEGEVEAHRLRLFNKVEAVLKRAGSQEIDEGRLLQEVTYLCDRSDISEELIRLSSHLKQCLDLIDESGAIGRQIEFLVQEILRETNTIASKATSADVKRRAVHIKVDVEKIREQVQNVE